MRVRWSMMNKKWYTYSHEMKEVVLVSYWDIISILKEEVIEERKKSFEKQHEKDNEKRNEKCVIFFSLTFHLLFTYF